jgi:hypothetical protein
MQNGGIAPPFCQSHWGQVERALFALRHRITRDAVTGSISQRLALFDTLPVWLNRQKQYNQSLQICKATPAFICCFSRFSLCNYF